MANTKSLTFLVSGALLMGSVAACEEPPEEPSPNIMAEDLVVEPLERPRINVPPDEPTEEEEVGAAVEGEVLEDEVLEDEVLEDEATAGEPTAPVVGQRSQREPHPNTRRPNNDPVEF